MNARADLVEPTGLGTVLHLQLDGQDFKAFTTDRPAITVGERGAARGGGGRPAPVRSAGPASGCAGELSRAGGIRMEPMAAGAKLC